MNWQNIISDLQQTGLTQAEIARLADCSQPLINELLSGRRGKNLSYSIGSKLINLHAERCPSGTQQSSSLKENRRRNPQPAVSQKPGEAGGVTTARKPLIEGSDSLTSKEAA
jgi:hypothetical protein